MSSRHVEKSRTFPAIVGDAFDDVLSAPLPEIFSRRYGAIAPIAEVTGQAGEWGVELGRTRTIHLKDGTTMLETLTRIDRGEAFGYSIGGITGMMKPLVASATGLWKFEPAGTGVRITWSWDIVPTAIGRAAMPVFARLWSGYARQAMDQIEQILLGQSL
ncbi:MAG: SRPBCC family protein [Ilumatobacteraceae bacterium]